MRNIQDIFINDNKGTEYKINDLQELLKASYRKLKSEVYFDTSNVFMRKKIADFEKYEDDKNNIDKRIESLAKKIMSNKLDEYIKNIGYNCLPKSVIANEDEEKNYIKNYINNSSYSLKKVTYFIDIDIEAQILGVLWVLLFGKKLEKLYGSYIYGNKLSSNMQCNNIDLFKPYFNEYEKWKNNGIESVEKMLELGKRSFMISLDIQDYYYSTSISFDKLKKDLSMDLDSSIDLDLNMKPVFKDCDKISKLQIESIVFEFTKDVFIRYTKKLIEDKILQNNKPKEKRKNAFNKLIIPIGFIPSKIISNWYLKELDNDIVDKLNPMYYGRYIDDILIVLPIYKKKNIQSYKYILNDYFCNNGIFTYALYNQNKEMILLDGEDKIKNLEKILRFIPREEIDLKKELKIKIQNIEFDIEYIEKDINKIEIDIFEDWDNDKIIQSLDCLFNELNKEKNKFVLDKLYRDIITELKFNKEESRKLYIANGYFDQSSIQYDRYIAIQEAKVRVFEFKHNGSKALLDAFKLELKKNASIFRFLPEKTEVLNSFDREAFKIDYLDNMNKLSDIKGFDISKYKLSKFLARIIYSDKLENDNYTKELDSKILWAFKDNRCIEYFTLWEKVLVYYIINNKYKNAYKFIKNILKSIENLDINIDKFQMYYPKEINADKIISRTRDGLIKHLEIILSLVYALDDNLFENYNENMNNKDYLDEFDVIQHISKNIDLKQVDITESFKEIKLDRDKMRESNMIRHDLVREVLLNYTNLIVDKKFKQPHLNLINKKTDITNIESRYKCTIINDSYNNRKKKYEDIEINNCKESCKDRDKERCKDKDYCKYDLSGHAISYSPRFVHLHELIIYEINYKMARGQIICGNEYIRNAIDKFGEINGITFDENYINRILSSVEDVEGNNIEYYNTQDYLFTQKEAKINIFNLESHRQSKKLKIGIVNMRVSENDIVDSFNKVPNLSDKRLEKINRLLNSAVKNGAEMIVFPEVSIPYQWLGPISNFAKNNDVAIVCGLEHIIYENKLCCNYLATILPEKYKSYSYSLIKLRLKNTYSPREKQWINGYNWRVPVMIDNRLDRINNDKFIKEYDLFRWRGVDFSSYSCFELANIKDRALFGSYVDLLIGSVHNKDTNYYSNVIESLSRDIHCYFVQVNNSELGDNRIISPSPTVKKNIVQVTGGLNDVVLIGEIDIESLRSHQQLDHSLQMENKEFKPSPPEFNYENVRIRNKLPL